ncbi:MAG: adpP, partial [Rhodospirillaceae bacterium]
MAAPETAEAMIPRARLQAKDVEILDRDTAYQGFFRIDRYRLRHRLYNGAWGPHVTRE